MTWDIPGMIKEGFRFFNTALKKFKLSVEEKEGLDRYNAKKQFKEFREKVIRETKERTKDLDD